MERIEIQPASVLQVHRSLRTGARVLVSADVQQIAQDLHEIRASLRLEHDPLEDIWVVLDRVVNPDGSIEDKLVTTWDVADSGAVDQRLVQRVREIAHPSYNLAAELDRIDAQADRDASHRFRERMGPVAERLQHALRKDLGLGGNQAYVPKAVDKA